MKLRIFLIPLMLAGCVTTPIVSDFNGSSVKIVESFGGTKPSEATIAEAKRICAKVGKTAEGASARSLPNYDTEYLFLCL
jgi:glycerate-2-kinase